MRAAVDCYWATIVEANDPPDPDHPGFARCFTGPALERSQQRVLDHQMASEYVKDPSGVERFSTTLLELTDGSARVTECFIDDAVVYSVDGAVIDDSVASYDVEFLIRLVDGVWGVSDSISWQRRDGRSC